MIQAAEVIEDRKLTVSIATTEDVTNIIDFFIANARPTLPPPSDDEILKSVENGNFYFGFLGGQRNRIVATGGAFEWITGTNLKNGDAEPNIVVYELAAMRVTSAVGGTNPSIQDVLIWLRTLDLAVNQHVSSGVCVMTAVLGAAEKSLAAMSRTGFQIIEEKPRWLEYQHHAWTRSEPATYFWLPNHVLQGHASAFRDFLNSGAIVTRLNRETGIQEIFELRLDVPWVEIAEKSVASLAETEPNVFQPPPKLKRLGSILI